MEKRALIAIVLSVVLLIAWQALFSPPAAPPPPPEGRDLAPVGPSTPAPATSPEVSRAPRPAPVGAAPTPPGTVAEVITPLYRASFGQDGAATRWVLTYRGDKEVILGAPLGPLAVAVSRAGQASEPVALVPQAQRLELGRARPEGTLTFRGTTADGTPAEKTLTFRADSYRIGLQLRVGRAGTPGRPGTLAVYWTTPVAVPGTTQSDPWLTFGEGAEHRQMLGRILVAQNGRPAAFEPPAPALKDLKEAPGGPGAPKDPQKDAKGSPANARELKDPHLVPAAEVPLERRWVALENDYFIVALIPSAGVRVQREREPDRAVVALVFPESAGAPGTGQAELYVGPKEWDRLAALGVGLEQAQARNYGDFLWTLPMQWFCVPLLWLMNFFATRLPGQNYGIAIILLTVLVKILFYPLAQKSMTSMKQMQALQPQVNALRSKYKSDPQRFQREQMELFRKHKVNPVGGCLPMVVQIPIFYALYLTLQYSVELQGAHFFLWITDLSKKDPYYVLPILMGVSMLIQQKMTPTVGDPRQARVMLIMPVIFTFMFLEFPTGLVLYWLVNNVLSIGQQYLIDRAVARTKIAAPVEGKGNREARKG